MSAGPVFVTGLADSGKTPLSRLLTDATSIVVTRHTRLWSRPGDLGEVLAGPRQVDERLTALLRDPAIQRLHPDPDRLRAALDGQRPRLTDVLALVHAQHAERLGKSRWGEQCGEVSSYADRLLALLPAAQVVHLVRDPVASFRISATRRPARPGRLGRFTARWLADVERARRNAARHPERYLLVRYEALAARTPATFRAICRFLAEPHDDHVSTLPDAPSRSRGRLGAGGGKYDAAAAGAIRPDDRDAWFVALHAPTHLRTFGYPWARRQPPRVHPTVKARWSADQLALAIARGASTPERTSSPGV